MSIKTKAKSQDRLVPERSAAWERRTLDTLEEVMRIAGTHGLMDLARAAAMRAAERIDKIAMRPTEDAELWRDRAKTLAKGVADVAQALREQAGRS